LNKKDIRRKVNRNRIKLAIIEKRKAYGFSLTVPCPEIVEILGQLDLDFVYIDGEHGAMTLKVIEDVCRIADLVDITPIARVPDISSATIGTYLDRGVKGIIAPHISTKNDAEQLVSAAFYGPKGTRSFGHGRNAGFGYLMEDVKKYMNEANEGIVIGAMIEDLDGINNLNVILDVDGIDLMLVGPNDLAQGLGFPGDKNNIVVQDAIKSIIDKVHAKGKLMRKDVLVYTWDYSLLLSAGKEIFKAGPDTIFP